jgi:serine/threonine-protein kinase
MAPEQILGGEVDRRCDVFATGIVLYLLATGRHPFKRHNTAAVIHAITTDDPVAPPSTLIEDFPAELERVLLKALEKDREQRWSSAEEMRIALEQALPEAFGDAGRAQLREFMDGAVGDRKAARREAVRRAQARADELDLGSGARKALQAASAQSAASLRAISISTEDAEEVPEPANTESQEPASVAATRAKRRRSLPLLTAAAGVVLAILVALPRLVAPRASGTAASGVQAGTSLHVEPKATPPAVTATAAPASVPAVSSAAASTSTTPIVEAPLLKAKRAATGTKKTSGKASTNGSSDLLTPDYAR